VPTGRKNVVELTGEEARRATSLLLPPINKFGGTSSQVSSAVGLLDLAGDPLYYVASVARRNDALGSIEKIAARRAPRHRDGQPRRSRAPRTGR
jgi:hypothetical protein